MDENFINEIKEIRRLLHSIPETGFNEFKTSAFVKEYLINLGYNIEEVAKTGVVACKKGKKNKAVAFRADMDALNILEKTNVDFKSMNEGQMHACGHDGHMAILLGLAKYLTNITELEYDIVFIFQPAEEGPGGAKLIIEEGIFKKYNIEYIFGLHIFPGIDEGIVGLANGPIMAQCGEFDIKINAKNGHGAMPQNGIDAIYIASHLIQAYQSILSRNIDPLEAAVLNIGKISGGEARNIIPGSVSLEGTIRTFNTDIYNIIKKRIKEINDGLEKMFNINIEMDIRDLYPPVINDSYLYDFIKSILNKDEIVDIKPLMISEDFSYYQQVTSGFFMLLGARNEELGYIHPLHSCYFNFNEDILIKGIEIYINICKKLCVF